jgi:hypothetical protein
MQLNNLPTLTALPAPRQKIDRRSQPTSGHEQAEHVTNSQIFHWTGSRGRGRSKATADSARSRHGLRNRNTLQSIQSNFRWNQDP